MACRVPGRLGFSAAPTRIRPVACCMRCSAPPSQVQFSDAAERPHAESELVEPAEELRHWLCAAANARHNTLKASSASNGDCAHPRPHSHLLQDSGSCAVRDLHILGGCLQALGVSVHRGRLDAGTVADAHSPTHTRARAKTRTMACATARAHARMRYYTRAQHARACDAHACTGASGARRGGCAVDRRPAPAGRGTLL